MAYITNYIVEKKNLIRFAQERTPIVSIHDLLLAQTQKKTKKQPQPIQIIFSSYDKYIKKLPEESMQLFI